MKYLILIIPLFFFHTAKSQSTISLEQAATYTGDSLFPSTVNYVKDINHKLDPFIGTWKGTKAGRLYEVRFIKKTEWDYGQQCSGCIKWDCLVGRVLIKDSLTNQIIYNTLDSADNKTYFKGDNFGTPNVYNMYFGVNSGCYDVGDVNISISTLDSSKLFLIFRRDVEWIDPSTCPGGYANYKTLFPLAEWLTLTKQ